MKTVRVALRDFRKTLARAAVAGFWSVVFAGTCLWTTGYPLEHWVTVSLAFTLCFVMWSALSAYLCGLALKSVAKSIRRSIENNGLDPDEILARGRQDPSYDLSVRLTIAIIALSSLCVSWGLAFATVSLSLPLVGLPPLSTLIRLLCFGILGMGSGLLLGMFLGMFSARQKAQLPTKTPRALSLPSHVGVLRWTAFL